MKTYCIQATVTRDNVTRQLPTFYLDGNVQGIVSEDHAREIASAMFRSINPDAEFHIIAVEVSP